MKHIGSTLAMILGVLVIVTGLSKASAGGSIDYLNSGLQMLLGAMACRWAKKRKFDEIPNTGSRKILEGVLIFFAVAITVFRSDLPIAIALDPFPNLIIPVWVVFAYLVAVFKKPNLLK